MFRAPSPTDVPLRRRALVVTVPGLALGLAACDLEPRSTDAGPGAGGPPEDPDLVALGDTVAATDAAAALVAATMAAHPALGPRLAALAEVHTAHRAALDGAAELPEEPPTTAPATVPARQAQALVALRRAESGLAADLAARALEAESGPFARLLAVMSAAVQQQLLGLDRRGGA